MTGLLKQADEGLIRQGEHRTDRETVFQCVTLTGCSAKVVAEGVASAQFILNQLSRVNPVAGPVEGLKPWS